MTPAGRMELVTSIENRSSATAAHLTATCSNCEMEIFGLMISDRHWIDRPWLDRFARKFLAAGNGLQFIVHVTAVTNDDRMCNEFGSLSRSLFIRMVITMNLNVVVNG